MTSQEIPTWMKIFLRQDMLEEKEHIENPVRLVDKNVRSLLWWLCKQHAITAEGVMGYATRLLERYIAKKIKLYLRTPQQSNQFHNEVSKRLPLLASVCIALTTKMTRTEQQLRGKMIQSVLAKINIQVTLAQVNFAELNVLQSLEFYLPLYTNAEKALMMAVDVGITGLLLDAVEIMMDVTEYYLNVIQEEIISVAFTMPENKHIPRRDVTNVMHVHLAAGCVFATHRRFLSRSPDPLPRLAFLTQCSKGYIQCISDVIYKCIATKCGFDQPSRKRKHE